MKKLPTEKTKLDAITKLELGSWRVTEKVITRIQAGEPRPFHLVQIWFDGRCVFESHGRVALLNSMECVNRWHVSGYIPKPPAGKVLADYASPESRGTANRKYFDSLAKRH